MTLRELRELVLQGEHQHLEFKKRSPEPYRLAREISAFANSGGGILLIGVDDDGRIIGTRDADEELFAIHNALHLMDPPPETHTELVELDGMTDVVVVTIPEGRTKPYSIPVPDTGEKEAFIRKQAQSLKASREMKAYLRYNPGERNLKVELGPKEAMLMNLIDNEGYATVISFAAASGIPSLQAGRTLVHLTRAGILRLEPFEDGDRFFLHGNTLASS